MKITAITCTGSRPVALSLGELWMKAQTRQPDRWIVVDDGPVPSAVTMGQTVLRPPPIAGHSLPRNVAAALRYIDANPLDRAEDGKPVPEIISFWEDDDYYTPWWLARVESEMHRMGNRGELPSMVGEGLALYYNVRYRRWFRHFNVQHCSLAMTSIRSELIPYMLDGWPLNFGAENPALIDWRAWDQENKGGWRANRRIWLPDSLDRCSVVGMKGMPGRSGMADGHRPDQLDARWQHDPQGGVLHAQIEDPQVREIYLGFYAPIPEMPQVMAPPVAVAPVLQVPPAPASSPETEHGTHEHASGPRNPDPSNETRPAGASVAGDTEKADRLQKIESLLDVARQLWLAEKPVE